MKKYFVFAAFSLLFNFCTQEPESTTKHAALFKAVPSEKSGVNFINKIKEKEQQNFLRYPYYYNGGGVAIGDINNDGLADIYFTGNIVGDRLYLNQEGLSFQDITLKAGILKTNLWTTGVSFADVNNDGWLDIYVCRSGQGSFRNNLLYINQANGKFVEQAKLYGLNDNGYSVQANFFDYDLDGDLDMYLVNHSIKFFVGQEQLFALKNNPEPDEADKLYRNNGDLNGSGQITFEDVSKAAGIRHFGFGLSASIGDLNQDAYPDIYVANDFFEADLLYLNNGDGSFSNALKQAIGHTSFSSMGSDIADFNNDGLPDIMVCDMQAADNYRKKANMASMDPRRFARIVKEGYHYQYMQNTLQLNSGKGSFSEIAELAGVAETDWSWGPLFFDMDNDGWKDLFVSNGIRRDIQYKDILSDLGKKVYDPRTTKTMDLIEKFPVAKLKNYSFRNDGHLGFSDQSDEWGIYFEGFSTGAAYADLDNDGDLDLVLNNLDDPASIYENLSRQQEKAAQLEKSGSNYIQISLKGVEDNVFGLGASVKITTGKLSQYQYLQSTRGFQSSVEPLIHMGLGSYAKIDEIEIRWPNGTFSYQGNIAANQRIVIQQETATKASKQLAQPPGLFSEQSKNINLNYTHSEERYNDFAKEILLPHKYSQLGPCISTGDVNGDALDDFYIGGAKGQAGQLFIQSPSGQFQSSSNTAWNKDKTFEDTGALFFDADGDGDLDLYVASGSNEWEAGSPSYQDRLYFNNGAGQFTKKAAALPKMLTSTSCVRPADFDGDGDLDLFVGGRLVPGQYPIAARSYLLSNEGGIFTDVADDVIGEAFEAGLVTDAQWTDFDNDQDLDLMLVGEWMPITLYRNNNDSFEQVEIEAFKQSSGWWYSLVEADMDQDGDMDYIAGNLGLNYKYKASQSEPFQVYAHDFDANGSLDIVLGYFNEGELFPLRGKQCSSEQMPNLKEKFPNYAEFASATLPEVYGEQLLEQALHYKAHNFASTYIENLGAGQFQLHQLPVEAQLSSVNGIIVEDLDKDGLLDLILAGNMYGAEVETARNDAGLGLVLKGNGKGTFTPLSPVESGFLTKGDVKSLAKLKLGNGTTAILVGNNSDRIQAFTLKNLNQ